MTFLCNPRSSSSSDSGVPYCCCYYYYRASTLVQSTVLGLHVVRPSVTLVICDHIGWKSWKLITQTISPTPLLYVAKRRSTYSQRNMGKFGGDKRWGREKVAFWRTKVAISLKRVNIDEKLLWRAYRNHQCSFER